MASDCNFAGSNPFEQLRAPLVGTWVLRLGTGRGKMTAKNQKIVTALETALGALTDMEKERATSSFLGKGMLSWPVR